MGLDEGNAMRSTSQRIAATALVAITVSTLAVTAICAVGIARTSGDTAIGWTVALVCLLLGSAGAAAYWPFQFLRARRAARVPAEARQVVPLMGVFRSLHAPYLVLVAPHHPMPGDPGFRYERGVAELQRVLWDPAINTLRVGDTVLVHRRGRRAVVDLPDGSRLWPSGPLRAKEPRSWTFMERPSVARIEYRELRERARRGDEAARAELTKFIEDDMRLSGVTDPLDPVFDLVPEPVTTRPGLVYPLTLAVVAGFSTLLRIGPVAAVVAVIYAVGFGVHLWACYGGEPERVSFRRPRNDRAAVASEAP
jgi:type IV secretory pathway VirB2 component (pilin)